MYVELYYFSSEQDYLDQMKKFKLSLIAMLCLSLQYLSAQVDYDKVGEVAGSYYLQNVQIIQSPDKVIERGAVLIKNGIIQQVGANVRAPYDAEIVKADSMYVYAAFIDGLSHTGIKKEEGKEERPNVRFPGDPPDEVAGITPGRKVDEMYNPKESSISKMREVGFGIAHIVPIGKMLPGYGSIVSLSGHTEKNTLLKEDVSLFSQFKTSRGVYPGTIIGIIAKYKDLYRNASYKLKYNKSYALAPQGLERPDISDSEAAFFPVIEKKMPVFFTAEKHKDIARAIQLKKELGFDMVVADVKQGDGMAKKLKGMNIPVLLSLSLPKEMKDMEEEEKKDKSSEDNKEESKKTEEQIALEKRKKESYDSYISQAAKMEAAGISFGFSMIDSKPKEVQATLRRMIAAGLSEKTALAALTTNTAKMLNITNIAGTVEQGKMANLMVTDKPYFEKGANVRFMFVDGQKFTYESKKKKKKKNSSGETIDLSGLYSYVAEVPGQTEEGEINIEKDGDSYKLTLTSNDDPGDPDVAQNVSVDGNNVSFTLDLNNDGMTMSLLFDLDFTEEDYEGTVSVGEFGTFPFTGEKKSKPE